MLGSLQHLTQHVMEALQELLVLIQELIDTSRTDQLNFDIANEVEYPIPFGGLKLPEHPRFEKLLLDDADKMWVVFILFVADRQ